MERLSGRRFTKVDRKAGGIVLHLGQTGGRQFDVVRIGASQVKQFEAVCGAHPGGRHQERDANAKIEL